MALDPITGAEQLAQSFIERFIPDKTQAAAAVAQLAQMKESGELQLLTAQVGVDAEEAKSGSMFIAGARPFIMWVCGLAVMYDTVIYPIAVAYVPALHAVDTVVLMPILLALLGIRTVEKHTGNDTQVIK